MLPRPPTSITLHAVVPASLFLSSDIHAWPKNFTMLTHLLRLDFSHILATLSEHPAVPPPLCVSTPPRPSSRTTLNWARR